jgi:hypothetical protein
MKRGEALRGPARRQEEGYTPLTGQLDQPERCRKLFVNTVSNRRLKLRAIEPHRGHGTFGGSASIGSPQFLQKTPSAIVIANLRGSTSLTQRSIS